MQLLCFFQYDWVAFTKGVGRWPLFGSCFGSKRLSLLSGVVSSWGGGGDPTVWLMQIKHVTRATCSKIWIFDTFTKSCSICYAESHAQKVGDDNLFISWSFLGTDFEAVAFYTQYFNRAYQVWDCLQALPLAASEEGVANAAAAVLVAAALVAGRNHLHKASYTTTVEMKALGSACSMSRCLVLERPQAESKRPKTLEEVPCVSFDIVT